MIAETPTQVEQKKAANTSEVALIDLTPLKALISELTKTPMSPGRLKLPPTQVLALFKSTSVSGHFGFTVLKEAVSQTKAHEKCQLIVAYLDVVYQLQQYDDTVYSYLFDARGIFNASRVTAYDKLHAVVSSNRSMIFSEALWKVVADEASARKKEDHTEHKKQREYEEFISMEASDTSFRNLLEALFRLPLSPTLQQALAQFKDTVLSTIYRSDPVTSASYLRSALEDPSSPEYRFFHTPKDKGWLAHEPSIVATGSSLRAANAQLIKDEEEIIFATPFKEYKNSPYEGLVKDHYPIKPGYQLRVTENGVVTIGCLFGVLHIKKAVQDGPMMPLGLRLVTNCVYTHRTWESKKTKPNKVAHQDSLVSFKTYCDFLQALAEQGLSARLLLCLLKQTYTRGRFEKGAREVDIIFVVASSHCLQLVEAYCKFLRNLCRLNYLKLNDVKNLMQQSYPLLDLDPRAGTSYGMSQRVQVYTNIAEILSSLGHQCQQWDILLTFLRLPLHEDTRQHLKEFQEPLFNHMAAMRPDLFKQLADIEKNSGKNARTPLNGFFEMGRQSPKTFQQRAHEVRESSGTEMQVLQRT